jgi:hypothetical protein
MKIQQYPLMLVLNFVIPMVFWSFQYEIKMKKYLLSLVNLKMTNKLCKKT